MSIIIDGTGTISGVSATGLTTAQTVTQSTIATGVAGTGPSFSAYSNATQTISQSVATKILFQTEVWDTNSNFASSTFTPTVAGYYQINAAICWNAPSPATAQQDAIFINKNGSVYQIGSYSADPGTIGVRVLASTIVYCNGSTDYIEIFGLYNAGQATGTVVSGSTNTWFNGALIRAA